MSTNTKADHVQHWRQCWWLFILEYTCTALHCKGTSVFLLENCSAAIRYILPDPSILFSFLSWNAGWNMLHTNVYSAVMYGLLSRMVATFGIPKPPKLATSDKWLLCMHRLICMCIAALTTPVSPYQNIMGRMKTTETAVVLSKDGCYWFAHSSFWNLVDTICFYYKPSNLHSVSIAKRVAVTLLNGR